MGQRTTKTDGQTWATGDRVNTPAGPGAIVREVRNLYLLRPGRAFEIQLDDGHTVDVNEHELTTP